MLYIKGVDSKDLAKWDALDKLEVARPCSESWDDMVGGSRVRLCSKCDRRVYNFAKMSKDEIARLLEYQEGRMCAVLYKRADGKLMTKDCPKSDEYMPIFGELVR